MEICLKVVLRLDHITILTEKLTEVPIHLFVMLAIWVTSRQTNMETVDTSLVTHKYIFLAHTVLLEDPVSFIKKQMISDLETMQNLSKQVTQEQELLVVLLDYQSD